MIRFFVLVICFLSFHSCHSKANQYSKTNLKTGKWIEKSTDEDGITIRKGKYKEGKRIGTWKTFLNDTLFEKEKKQNNITKVYRYFPSGKIRERGQTKTDIKNAELHWYYFGDWKYYNEKGKLLYIKKYASGGMTDSIAIQK